MNVNAVVGHLAKIAERHPDYTVRFQGGQGRVYEITVDNRYREVIVFTRNS